MRKCFFLIVIVSFLLTACGGAPDAAPGDKVPVVRQEAAGLVTAEGVVVPAQRVTLRAVTGGRVVGVEVAEGDRVAAGQTLLRFDPVDAELAVRQAEAGLALAQAQLAAAEAGARAEQVAVIEAQLAAAEAGVVQAAAYRDELAAGLVEADVVEAQAQVVAAASGHRRADEAHDDTMACFDVALPGGSETICPALGPYEEMARFQLEAAYTGLVAAQAQLDTLQGSVSLQADAAEAAVLAAAAARDGVQAQLELARSGSRREEIALAEAGVEQAGAALERARLLLDLCSVDAPFDGTIVDIGPDAGDTAAAGEPVATLGTLDNLQVETTDLTEMDVARVAAGQVAYVTVDAAPGRVLAGRVARVDRQGVNYLGDVVYPVVVALDDPADWLRWGLSAGVEIAVEPGAQASTAAGGEARGDGPIIAEAVVEPARWSGLRFVAGGEVVVVPVSSGDAVSAGDVLVQLDPANAALAVQEARAALAMEEAQLALVEAGPRAGEVAAAEALLAAAQADLWQAVALRDQLEAGAAEAELAGARAELEAARAEALQIRIARDQLDEDDKGTWETLDEQLAAADLSVAAAEARLAALPEATAARLRAADAGVQAARAQVDVAAADLALLQAGATAEELAIAEARVQQAAAALAEAEVALDRTALRAPFAGIVTRLAVEVGDTVGAGQVVAVLAALDHVQIATVDLSELDVLRVAEGAAVEVRVDALPGQTFAGRIARVGLQGIDYRGDVVIPVVVELGEAAPGLLWGMTAAVEIEETTSALSGAPQ